LDRRHFEAADPGTGPLPTRRLKSSDKTGNIE